MLLILVLIIYTHVPIVKEARSGGVGVDKEWLFGV